MAIRDMPVKSSAPASMIPVRDVADFHLRWREFRPEMTALAETRKLTARQREILNWLILLTDRIGPGDVHSATSV
jgi:hypothetical protein